MQKFFLLALVAALIIPTLPLPLIEIATPAAAQTEPEAECPLGDINCDDQYTIVDLQRVAANIGREAATVERGDRLDLDADGTIAVADLNLLSPAWRSQASSLAGGPPRLGYAVDPNGNVFLRWQVPVSPYDATVEVLRRPAPPTAPNAAGRGWGLLPRSSRFTTRPRRSRCSARIGTCFAPPSRLMRMPPATRSRSPLRRWPKCTNSPPTAPIPLLFRRFQIRMPASPR
ncbi:MAG: hypothetical protein HC822_16860 [Oscillochloris sp.]|nr:hypothetical protein [Oscillochloris sp.]